MLHRSSMHGCLFSEYKTPHRDVRVLVSLCSRVLLRAFWISVVRSQCFRNTGSIFTVKVFSVVWLNVCHHTQ